MCAKKYGNSVTARALCVVNYPGKLVVAQSSAWQETTKIIKAIATVRSCRDWHGSGLPPRIDADK